MMLGLGTALQYYASRDDFRSQQTLNTAAAYALGCAIVFFVVVQVAFLGGHGDRVLPAPFNSHFFRGLITLHFLFWFFAELLGSILNSHKLFEQTSKLRITTIAFISLAFGGLFYLDRTGARVVLVDYYYFVLAADHVFYVVLGLLVYIKLVAPAGVPRSWTLLPRSTIIKLFSFGLFPWISGFLMRALMMLDYWFVEEFAGLDALGVYFSRIEHRGDALFDSEHCGYRRPFFRRRPGDPGGLRAQDGNRRATILLHDDRRRAAHGTGFVQLSWLRLRPRLPGVGAPLQRIALGDRPIQPSQYHHRVSAGDEAVEASGRFRLDRTSGACGAGLRIGASDGRGRSGGGTRCSTQRHGRGTWWLAFVARAACRTVVFCSLRWRTSPS